MRLLISLFFIGCGLLPVSTWADAAGEVTFAGGAVQVGKLANGSVVVGTAINTGDVLLTGANGHLHIKLPDGGLLILRPNSSAVVSDYVFVPEDLPKSRMRITVTKGTVRSVTGSWAKLAPGQFRLNTPIAAIGVRGTDFTVVADQEMTRASVSFGGIVMAALGSGCSQAAVGPCEGALSTELFSGNPNLMLQVTMGDIKPRILDGRALGILPDSTTPPSSAEPGVGASGKTGAPLSHGNLEPVTAVALPDKPLPPEPTQIKWGRWAILLNGEAEGQEVRANATMVAANAKFAMFRDTAHTFVMPQEGMASFKLAKQDSFFYQMSSGTAIPAIIDNASLLMDFGARTFSTDFDMQGGGLDTHIQAKGGLFPDGRFVSSVVSSNASVSGVLAGTGGSQAGFLFHRPLSSDVTATGATYWTR